MHSIQQQALKEKAIRILEERYQEERGSLFSYMRTMWEKEKKETLISNRHLIEMCEKLEAVYRWEIKRLIINIPPRSGKTETVGTAFTTWVLGKKPNHKFLNISYSAELAQKSSRCARNRYDSETYRRIFPRFSPIKKDQDTKKYRENEEGGQFYSAWSSGTITGMWCDIIVIDDPLKPDDAQSDTVRVNINNNFDDTISSRLNNKKEGAIVIIMQRLHDDDLCGMLMRREEEGIGETWHKLIVPAIDLEWKSFFEDRFPIDLLLQEKKTKPVTFSTQYMQEPVNKETQEFHEEWFRYYDNDTLPKDWRVFTTCDPAFTKNKSSDYSAIMTCKVIDERVYILEYTQAKLDPWELIDKLIYHTRKRNPEKIGVEAFQAQTIIWYNLKLALEKANIFTNVEEIKQSGDKLSKIRRLIPMYRNGQIYHKTWMDELEHELKRFPRWLHDDIIDSLQMLFEIWHPTKRILPQERIEIKYDSLWRPFI